VNSMQTPLHEPVMIEEVLRELAVEPGGSYIDCTLGEAGHALAILDACTPGGRLLGLDADPEACASARARLDGRGFSVVVNANFDTLEAVAAEHGFVPAHGVLFDFGLSSRQLDAEDRGFSFRRPGPLDMRFSGTGEPTAADLVNGLPEEELADLIYQLGEEPRSRRIARGIVDSRPLADAAALAEVVRRSSGYRRGRTHPATRTFQALRIAVNDEIERLKRGLEQAMWVLKEGGRLVTIAYHSLEDREIKRFIASPENNVRAVHKRVIKPSKAEVARNRRSRSAKIRVAERP
jgi:16S rRNA (cytosine1402-N4)-methyltransferase